ncbi:MAG: VWA domain-containing protein [Deltaproteobacteria bacterium]|nr:VWA domain-containing protein [Deltaproteobacteria bacterium]
MLRNRSETRPHKFCGGFWTKHHFRQRLIEKAALAAISAIMLVACTDVPLYQWNKDPFRANKLTVSGTVCTDDPRQQDFPVKILFVVDGSPAVMQMQNDLGGQRATAMTDLIAKFETQPNYSFGVIRFAGRVENMIPEGFTRDSSLLTAVAGTLRQNSMGCDTGRCRDLMGALNLASSVITGDVLASNPGEVSRTSYVVVLFTTGGPAPAISRCACRNVDSEVVYWPAPNCTWTECDIDQSQGTIPVCAAPSWDQPSCPDTFTHWVLPADPTNPDVGLPTVPGNCAPCDFCCVYPVGGRPGSCEERSLTNVVRELRGFALDNGAAQFQFHAAYLPDRAIDTYPSNSLQLPPPCTCSDGSDCRKEAEWERSTRLLVQMAHAGGGSFKSYYDPVTLQETTIDYDHVELFNSGDPLLFKEFVVTNANVLPTDKGIKADSDQDGLIDEAELALGLCPRNPDSDGDGVGDAIEVKLARDAKVNEEAIECIDLESRTVVIDDLCADPPGPTVDQRVYKDVDGDSLNACEERLLGTDDSLFDSDADGLPDKIEFVMGTNYLAVDPLSDPDFDGLRNRDEIRDHTDPRSNDAQEQLDLAYRYELIDEGIKPVVSFTDPNNITGIKVLAASAASSGGVGYLRFEPGPPATLAWRDPNDQGPGTDFGPAVDISVATQDGYKLESFRPERFIRVFVEGPSSYPVKQVVDQIVISTANRNCVRFRVRNITLLETLQAYYQRPDGPFKAARGDNHVYLYFAEAPKDAKSSFGVFRVAITIPNYLDGPPPVRTPKRGEDTFSDEEFQIPR